jgi:GNAT superfamily N-acetyltransferase
MDQNWSVRAYKEGDEEAIFELDSAVHGETMDKDLWLKRWHWNYHHNPAGSPIIWLAESNGKLVGQYPVNCVKMKIGEEIITGSQMEHLMTHPDYRRKGIFTTLARRALSDAGSKGLEITYGFPNQIAFPGHLKSGFINVGAVSAMIKPLNLPNILSQYTTNRCLQKIGAVSMNFIIKAFFGIGNTPEANGLTITRIPSFDERINGLWEKVSNDYEIMVVRDKEYLNWRYRDIPDLDYAIYVAEREGQILGYTVLRCQEQKRLVFGRIFELVVPSGHEEVAQALILKAIEFFKEKKADLVIYRMIANKTVGKTFRKSGFISLWSIGNRLRFVTCTNTPRISESFLKERSHWFIQTGDSDAI